MKYAIVTGTSRGLGEAIAKQLLEKGVIVFSVARHRNALLEETAKQAGVLFYPLSFDLHNLQDVEEVMKEIFAAMDLDSASDLYLVNNAGMLDPIKPVERAENELLVQNVEVNLLAPMLLISEFLKWTKDAPLEKRIINISSGAGKNPYSGWSAYCTTKAGIDMFTRCVALEEEGKTYPTKILSFAPGVVDTSMQEQIRNTDKEDFIHIDRFLSLKKEGKLLSPSYVARVIVDLLEADHFEQGGVVRINSQQ